VTVTVMPHQGFQRIHPAFPEGVYNDEVFYADHALRLSNDHKQLSLQGFFLIFP
jgi:hypothetical protein